MILGSASKECSQRILTRDFAYYDESIWIHQFLQILIEDIDEYGRGLQEF